MIIVTMAGIAGTEINMQGIGMVIVKIEACNPSV